MILTDALNKIIPDRAWTLLELSSKRRFVSIIVLILVLLCLAILVLKRSEGVTRSEKFVGLPIKQLSPISQSVYSTCLNQVVPRFLHLVWFYDKPSSFRFHHLIAVKAALRFFRPTKIFFWHNTVPTGIYWDECLKFVSSSQLLMTQIESPDVVMERKIFSVEHKSDVVRMQALLEYGGLYIDFDVILLRDITSLLCYEFTLGEDEDKTISNGFILSAPKAKFLQKWYDSYITFNEKGNWAEYSSEVPGRLARAYPSLIHIEDSTIYNPSYQHKDLIYKEEQYADLLNNYAIHLYYRDVAVDYDPIAIKTLNSTLGKIFRYVYLGNENIE